MQKIQLGKKKRPGYYNTEISLRDEALTGDTQVTWGRSVAEASPSHCTPDFLFRIDCFPIKSEENPPPCDRLRFPF